MNLLQKIIWYYRDILRRIGHLEEGVEYLVMFVDPGDLDAIIRRLWMHGYFYNDFSFRCRGEIHNARKIIGDYQIHIRIYSSGWVTAHHELKTEHPSDHLVGVGYRLLTAEERYRIIRMLELWR